jgi:hypothetical protein
MNADRHGSGHQNPLYLTVINKTEAFQADLAALLVRKKSMPAIQWSMLCQ